MTCDISELLGYERIIYGVIGGQKLIAKTNADDTISDNAIYRFAINKNKIHLFDPETGLIVY